MYFDGRTANYEKEPYLEITQKGILGIRGDCGLSEDEDRTITERESHSCH